MKYHLQLVNLPEDIQTKIHRGEISVGKARALAKLTIESPVRAVTGRFKQTTPTTKYHDEIRMLSLYEGLNDAKSVSMAADLVKEGFSAEEAAEEARKDYVERRALRYGESGATPPEEIALNLVENLPDPSELDKAILAQYPKLVRKLLIEGKLTCPDCGGSHLIWECSGRRADETERTRSNK